MPLTTTAGDMYALSARPLEAHFTVLSFRDKSQHGQEILINLLPHHSSLNTFSILSVAQVPKKHSFL